MGLPRKWNFPLDRRAVERAVERQDPEELLLAFQSVTRSLDRMYNELYRVLRFLNASDTWDPGSIADGDEEAKEVAIEGAELTDYAFASFSLDVEDLQLSADVTAQDVVTCVLSNNTGGAIDLGSGTLHVRVWKR